MSPIQVFLFQNAPFLFPWTSTATQQTTIPQPGLAAATNVSPITSTEPITRTPLPNANAAAVLDVPGTPSSNSWSQPSSQPTRAERVIMENRDRQFYFMRRWKTPTPTPAAASTASSADLFRPWARTCKWHTHTHTRHRAQTIAALDELFGAKARARVAAQQSKSDHWPEGGGSAQSWRALLFVLMLLLLLKFPVRFPLCGPPRQIMIISHSWLWIAAA